MQNDIFHFVFQIGRRKPFSILNRFSTYFQLKILFSNFFWFCPGRIKAHVGFPPEKFYHWTKFGARFKIELKGQSLQETEKKAFFPDFFSHRKKHRRHKNFGICFSHILDFINKKNYIRKISNGRVIHVLWQRLDTVGVKLREL